MKNILFVQFENELNTVYNYFVAIGCKLKDALGEIEQETEKKVYRASYNRNLIQEWANGEYK